MQCAARENSLAGNAVRNWEAYFTSAFLRGCGAALQRGKTDDSENVPVDIANPGEAEAPTSSEPANETTEPPGPDGEKP